MIVLIKLILLLIIYYQNILGKFKKVTYQHYGRIRMVNLVYKTCKI